MWKHDLFHEPTTRHPDWDCLGAILSVFGRFLSVPAACALGFGLLIRAQVIKQ
jgi:hypothetical protein